MPNNPRWHDFAAFLLLCYATESTATTDIIPRIEIGQSEYSIDFSGQIPSPDGTARNDRNIFSPDFVTYRFGATLIASEFFLDLYYQTSSEDTFIQLFPQFNAAEVWRARKKEYNLTTGWSVVENAFLFFGYRNHKQTARGVQNSDYKFTHSGFFVGGSYAWPLTETGYLSANIGYVWLNAEVELVTFGLDVGSSSGPGRGVKFGLVWRDLLSNNIFYSLSFDSYRFDHHLENRRAGFDVDVQEEEISLRLGLSKRF